MVHDGVVMNIPLLVVSGGLALALGGCNSAVFVATETKGGLSVTATNGAPSASLSYHRGELAVIPKNQNGTTHAVFGGVDHDYSLGGDGFSIAQTFATGQAAINASHNSTGGESGKNQNGTLYFATGTTFGLSLTTNDATSQSPSLLAGFRRAEGVYIPTDEKGSETNSVYADVSIVYWPKDSGVAPDDAAFKASGQDAHTLPLRKNAVRIRQKFATGDAAIQFVANDAVQAKLKAAAGGDEAAKAYVRLAEEKTTANQLQIQLQAVKSADQQSAILKDVLAIKDLRARIRPTDYADLRDHRVLIFKEAELTQLATILKAHTP